MSLVEVETPVLVDPMIRSCNLLIEPAIAVLLMEAVHPLSLERIGLYSAEADEEDSVRASKTERADERKLTIGKPKSLRKRDLTPHRHTNFSCVTCRI